MLNLSELLMYCLDVSSSNEGRPLEETHSYTLLNLRNLRRCPAGGFLISDPHHSVWVLDQRQSMRTESPPAHVELQGGDRVMANPFVSDDGAAQQFFAAVRDPQLVNKRGRFAGRSVR
jgi:hypothetical protein